MRNAPYTNISESCRCQPYVQQMATEFLHYGSGDFVDDVGFRRKATRASAALYINVDVRNGNLIKVLIFVGGEMRYRLCIWKYSVC